MTMDKSIFKAFTAGSKIIFIVLAAFTVISLFFSPAVFWIELVVTILLLAFYIYTARTKQRDLIKYVESITYKAGSAAKSSLLSFPLPIAVIDGAGELAWHNEMFAQIADSESAPLFNRSISEIFPGLDAQKILSGRIEQPAKVVLGNRHFNVFMSAPSVTKSQTDTLITMYFYDNTDYVSLKQEAAMKKSSVGVILIDNYEELISGQKESALSLALSQLDEFITAWVTKNGGAIQKYERDRYLFVAEEAFMKKALEDKFSILSAAKEYKIGPNRLPVTLSIGVGRDLQTFNEKFEAAKSAIDMALGRGGDQAVIKTRGGFEYYGGKTEGTAKRTKVRSRVVATALRELIVMADNVVIMGHKYADYDALGAAVGLYRASRNLNTNAKIVINPQSNMVSRMLERFSKKELYAGAFITPETAEDYVSSKTLLCIVDSHRYDYCEAPSLIGLSKHVAVIDHHRKSEQFIDNATLLYHEPFVSSTCEMVTEMLQYLGESGRIDRDEAEALLSGIMLDTKNFTFKTGVRTFEAAAHLKRCGADTIAVKRFFSTEFNNYRLKSDIVASAHIYHDCTAIAEYNAVEGKTTLAQFKEALSMAADELVSISQVQASFVIGEFGGTSHISARSMGEVNVQMILERLGGGGHQTMAGAQLKKSAHETVGLLKDAIDAYFER
ncbi:MAG: DHH family phosphoesterase [Clostridia bacterium]|nr:DHH family phosphoesterase [Clostridia bacterium]